jgi:hypothetical protein
LCDKDFAPDGSILCDEEFAHAEGICLGSELEAAITSVLKSPHNLRLLTVWCRTYGSSQRESFRPCRFLVVAHGR